MLTGLAWFGFCEHEFERSGFINAGNFLSGWVIISCSRKSLYHELPAVRMASSGRAQFLTSREAKRPISCVLKSRMLEKPTTHPTTHRPPSHAHTNTHTCSRRSENFNNRSQSNYAGALRTPWRFNYRATVTRRKSSNLH